MRRRARREKATDSSHDRAPGNLAHPPRHPRTPSSRFRRTPVGRSDLRLTCGAAGAAAFTQTSGGAAPRIASAARHRALEYRRRVHHPGARAPPQSQIRFPAGSARFARSARTGRARGYHHLDARHGLGRASSRRAHTYPARPRSSGREAVAAHDQAALRTAAEGDLRMSALFEFAVTFAQFCFALAMTFATIRLLRGPTAQDRVLALDTLYVNGMLMLLMLGI